MHSKPSGITKDFIEIHLPTRPHKKRKRRTVNPRALLLFLLLVAAFTVGPLLFLHSSQGQASPEALCGRYMKAFAADRPGVVYRLFPSELQSRHSGSRSAMVETLDDFAYAYGQSSDWSVLSQTDYPEASRQAFSLLLGREVSGYCDTVVRTTLDGQVRQLHLDMVCIKNRWYLAEVWNDDLLPVNGYDTPEDAVDTYLSALCANDPEGMALALAPALVDRAIAEGYGLRATLSELDDFFAGGLSGNPVYYTLTQTKDYSAYQAQSIAEILGAQPQTYQAFYYDATVGDTVYTLVVDLACLDGRWGITAVWDYNKSYVI